MLTLCWVYKLQTGNCRLLSRLLAGRTPGRLFSGCTWHKCMVGEHIRKNRDHRGHRQQQQQQQQPTTTSPTAATATSTPTATACKSNSEAAQRFDVVQGQLLVQYLDHLSHAPAGLGLGLFSTCVELHASTPHLSGVGSGLGVAVPATRRQPGLSLLGEGSRHIIRLRP